MLFATVYLKRQIHCEIRRKCALAVKGMERELQFIKN